MIPEDDVLARAALVALADKVSDELHRLPDDKARWQHVKGLVDQSDLVIGVWQDPSEPNGVGMLVVKGERLLRTIVAEQKSVSTMAVAIPCVCLEQAVALKEVAGEPPAYD